MSIYECEDLTKLESSGLDIKRHTLKSQPEVLKCNFFVNFKNLKTNQTGDNIKRRQSLVYVLTKLWVEKFHVFLNEILY